MHFSKPIAALVCLGTTFVGLMFLAVLAHRRPYSRTFGIHSVEIWISADDAGSSQEKIHGSYFRNFTLMRSYKSVSLPEHFESPTFTTIQQPTDNLICIHDNNGYGFLMIIDQATHEWYVGGTSNDVSPINVWYDHYKRLKQSHPSLPYSHYFQSKLGDSDNNPIDRSGGSDTT